MASKLLTASGEIYSGTTKKKVYKVILSATATSSCILRTGGSGGTQVAPAIRATSNNTVTVSFPGGILADYATLTGTSVNCWINYS
jgi:hypothetical protein